jgi:uncharacterized repeat protein (TIGR01451 family)
VQVPPAVISIHDASVAEGDAGTTQMTFTVTLSAAPGGNGASLFLFTKDGTATAPSDYTSSSPVVSWGPTDSSAKQFTVPVVGDTVSEPNEFFVVDLSDTTGNVTCTGGKCTASGTIVNDDAADLDTSMVASPALVAVGGTTTFTATVANRGPKATTGVVLTDALPSGLSFVSAAPSQGSCAGTSSLTCSLGSLGVGASATVAITARVNAVGTFANTVRAFSNLADPVAANNAATASVSAGTSPPADLAVTVRARVGQGRITYVATVQNRGPGAAAGVTLSDALPTTVRLLSAKASQGGCSGTTTVTCSLGTVANGGSATATVVVRPLQSGSILSRFAVAGSQGDPNSANDGADVVTGVSPVQVLPPPTPGRTANVIPIRGTVLVNGVPLTAPEQIRIGVVIDTTNGTVRLVTSSGSALFFEGAFRLRQSKGRRAFTELVLVGGNFGVCRARALAGVEKKRPSRQVRHLWGNGKGRFRTRGRYASATVRGTYWLTSDRCDGTLVRVRRGVIDAFDFVRRRTVRLRAGRSYLAKAP